MGRDAGLHEDAQGPGRGFRAGGQGGPDEGLLAPGGLAIVTAGYPIFGTPTNLIYVHKLEREK